MRFGIRQRNRPFVPLDIASLKLWLRADLGVTLNGAAVSAWADQSGLANNCSQTSAIRQPTFVASGLGEQPHLSFNDAIAHRLEGTFSPIMSTGQPYTLFFVGKWNNTTSNSAIFDTSDNGSTNRGVQLFGETTPQHVFRVNPGGTNAEYTRVTTAHVWTGTHITANRQIYEDKVQKASTTSSVSSGAYNTYRIGALHQDIYHHNGNISEVILYQATLSDAERGRVEDYMLRRYRI